MAKKPTGEWEVTLGGKPWTIAFSSRLKDWGYTDFPTRRISISTKTRVKGNDREVLIHEMLHAIFYTIEEATIDAAAVEMNEALDALGY